MPYIQADGEAETMCCYLAMNNEANAVLTEDTDVMAYGVPVFLSNYDSKGKTFVMVEQRKVLESLELTQNTFRDMCIMFRCDYNKLGVTDNGEIKPIPVKMLNPKSGKYINVGPVRAYDLVCSYGGFETINDNVEIDLDPLNYVRCRELLTIPAKMESGIIPYNQPIQPNKIKDFLRDNRCYVSFSIIDELWKPTPLKLVQHTDEENSSYSSDEEYIFE